MACDDDPTFWAIEPKFATIEKTKVYVMPDELRDADVLFHRGFVADTKRLGNKLFHDEVKLFRGL